MQIRDDTMLEKNAYVFPRDTLYIDYQPLPVFSVCSGINPVSTQPNE